MGFLGGGGGGTGAGGGGTSLTTFTGLTALTGALAAGLAAFFAAERGGLAERAGLRATRVRFFGGLRLEEVRAFTAGRNFAIAGL